MTASRHIYALRRLRDTAAADGDTRLLDALDAGINALGEQQSEQRLALTNNRTPLLVKRDKFSPRKGSGVRRAKLPIYE